MHFCHSPREPRRQNASQDVESLSVRSPKGVPMDDSQEVNVALRDFSQEEIERLRRLWDDGKASGDAGDLDFVELRKEARERLRVAKEAVD